MEEKIFGLLGRKLGHSWSVPIHKALGCGSYKLIELEPEDLGPFLAQENIGGLNVTIPYKRDVMPYCDVIDEGAQAIGSVNTLVRKADGKLYGYNTDIYGFMYMAHRAGISFDKKKVMVLGSGGASLTVQAAARREGAREVVVISRTGADNYGNLERHDDTEILVNATPVGMWPDLGSQPVDLKRLPNLEAVLDLIYNPTRTDLLLQAEKMGLRRAGGLSMLVNQAVVAEERFFDRSVSESETERILSELQRDRANLVLVGMPGCGKTTVGMELARIAKRPFVDLDDEIVRLAGKSIPEIFRKHGEPAFRALERKVLADVCDKNGQIIATGGGAILRKDNRTVMRRTGRVYFLRRDLDQLAVIGRPLSVKGTMKEMYHFRLPLYTEVSDISVDNSATPEEAAQKIWGDFCKNSGNEYLIRL
ncbi:MAG: shikimate kinase [Lawsonibacter sp.]|nr:shikimate kinase [Lawsonibacter sp.]